MLRVRIPLVAATLQLLGEALGWSVDEERLEEAIGIALRRRPHGLRNGGTLWRESRRWQLEELNASVSADLARAAVCDGELYSLGLERMRRSFAAIVTTPLRSVVHARAANSLGCAALLPPP